MPRALKLIPHLVDNEQANIEPFPTATRQHCDLNQARSEKGKERTKGKGQSKPFCSIINHYQSWHLL